MNRFVALALLEATLGCSRARTEDVATAPTAVTANRTAGDATAPAPPADDASVVPVMDASARSNCEIEPRIAALLMEQPKAIRCADLPMHASNAAVTAARACVLAAVRAERPFALKVIEAGIDSRVEEAFVGRRAPGDQRYATFWITYDGCPRGCGDADPHSTTRRCHPLVDAEAACAKERRLMKQGDLDPLPCRTMRAEYINLFCGGDDITEACPH